MIKEVRSDIYIREISKKKGVSLKDPGSVPSLNRVSTPTDPFTFVSVQTLLVKGNHRVCTKEKFVVNPGPTEHFTESFSEQVSIFLYITCFSSSRPVVLMLPLERECLEWKISSLIFCSFIYIIICTITFMALPLM